MDQQNTNIVNENIKRNFESNYNQNNRDPRKMTISMSLTSAIFSALFAVGGCFIGFPFSILLFVLSAGHMVASFVISKKPFAVLAILPAIALTAYYSLSFIVYMMLLTIPVTAGVMYYCVQRGMKKTVSVIITSVAVLIMSAIIFFVSVGILYGEVSAVSLKAVGEDFTEMWDNMVEQQIEGERETVKKLLDTYIEAGMNIDYEAEMKKLDSSIVQTRQTLDTYYQMIIYLCPSIIVALANIGAYLCANSAYRHSVKNIFAKVKTKKEDSVLTIETAGAVIFVLGFLIGIASGASTVVGCVGLNLFVIYLPALFVVGIRTFFSEGVVRIGCLSLAIVIVLLFVNPVLSVAMLGFTGAWSIIKNEITKLISKNND